MTKKIPIILDGDPGHDDAIAWVLANADPNLDILAVTTVSGNQTIEKTSYNAQRICTLIGLDVPIGKGGSTPLIREPMNAPSVHGDSGLDGPALPEPAFPLSDLSAVELIAEKVRECKDKVTLVPTGPLTNIAAFLLAHPELKNRIEQISLMGGGIELGNWTPAAEFNILVDPEAADIVFRSGIHIIMSGLDVTEKAFIKSEDVELIRSHHNEVAQIVAQWLEFFYEFHLNLGYEGAPVHDAVAVTALTHPEWMDIRELYVEVETKGKYCVGATVGDIHQVTGKAPNTKVLMGIYRENFINYIARACGSYREVKA